jgi:formylmethanofuran dehydrogenase subunit E
MNAPARLDEAPLGARSMDDLLAVSLGLHGHLCPGLVLGARMTLAGCREIGLDRPRRAGKTLVVFVEIDRCATDAIQALTGVSLGKRTLKYLDYGKMAATFVNTAAGSAVRVAARDGARALVPRWAPGERDPRLGQVAAYRVMPERDLLHVEPVVVEPGWLDRRRARVFCDVCGEGVSYQREVRVGMWTLCRPCSGDRYCATQGRAGEALRAQGSTELSRRLDNPGDLRRAAG